MENKIFSFAETFDLWVSIGAIIAAFVFFFRGDPLNAIFCILVAMFFSRGQDARFLASAIKEKGDE